MPSLLRVWLPLLHFVGLDLVFAARTFDPNCTVPPESVGFVFSPRVRGTLDILWSCIFTLLVCTWSVQHLNIPRQKPKDITSCWDGLQHLLDGKGGGSLKAALYWELGMVFLRVKWFVITLIFPELLVGRAFQDCIMAFESCKEMREYASADGVDWTLTHAFFANMGGFVLKVKIPGLGPADVQPHHSPPKQEPADHSDLGSTGASPPDPPEGLGGSERRLAENQNDGHLQQPLPFPPSRIAVIEVAGGTLSADAQPGGPSRKLHSDKITAAKTPQVLESVPAIQGMPNEEKVPNPHPTLGELESGSSLGSPPEDEQLYYLTAPELFNFRRDGIIQRLPKVSADEIRDKSKGDFFVKATAIVQVLWLVIQVITRHFKHLPSSQLEIAVLAFCLCAVVTYLLCLAKPQNVTIPICITSTRSVNPTSTGRQSWFEAILLGKPPKADMKHPVPNDLNFTEFKSIYLYAFTLMDFGVLFAGVSFGAVHFSALKLHFPHPIERRLWDISSWVTTTILPLYDAILLATIYTLAYFQHLGLVEDAAAALLRIARPFSYIAILAYVLGRMYLMVEAFRTLFFLPPESFISTWSSQIPHAS